ncbi:MAG: putative Histidine kinase [Acidobacteria bacterium]|nr:putative Histidine kinase [Acidobacteriota bacterium]
MGELLNLVCLITGVVLYAMLLAMVARAGRASQGSRIDPLLLSTALLGLIWNLCALPAYELPKVGIAGPFTLLVAAGFSALGFLPAVVVHSVLRDERDSTRVRGTGRQFVAATAYFVSTIAAGFHVGAAWSGAPLPSPFGMRLLTYSFIALVIPLAAVTRRQAGARRALWAAALSIFAVSALHLSQLHRGDASWPIELLGHHASLPLALAILYQDFPFALADIFLKRALTLLALVSAALLGVAAIGAIHSPEVPLRDPRDVGVLVTFWVGTALLYPAIRNGVGWFVDSIVLNRPDYLRLRAEIGTRIQLHQDIAVLLDDVCGRLAPALSARAVSWREHAAGPARDPHGPMPNVTTVVDIAVAEPPHYRLEIGDLIGGRRLLSDDHAAIEAVTSLVGRRIDAIRLARERYAREMREQEIGKLATEAELRALRAQINPHFLFNALTTIGYLIQTAPPRAFDTLMRLTGLLRSVFRSDGELTTLGREVELIESYLDIEHARFEQRLRIAIDVPQALKDLRVPPLLLQPVVENAVKHGISSRLRGGEVTVTARLDLSLPHSALVLVVHDTGPGVTSGELSRGRAVGVGLANVERRLACHYGAAASLSITSSPVDGTSVEIRLPADFRRVAALATTSTS